MLGLLFGLALGLVDVAISMTLREPQSQLYQSTLGAVKSKLTLIQDAATLYDASKWTMYIGTPFCFLSAAVCSWFLCCASAGAVEQSEQRSSLILDGAEGSTLA